MSQGGSSSGLGKAPRERGGDSNRRLGRQQRYGSLTQNHPGSERAWGTKESGQAADARAREQRCLFFRRSGCFERAPTRHNLPRTLRAAAAATETLLRALLASPGSSTLRVN